MPASFIDPISGKAGSLSMLCSLRWKPVLRGQQPDLHRHHHEQWPGRGGKRVIQRYAASRHHLRITLHHARPRHRRHDFLLPGVNGIGSAVFTLTVAVGPSIASGTVIKNTAAISSATTDASPGNNSATATTTVGSGSADLGVTNTDSPDPVMAGSNLTYTITVTNTGPSAATSSSLSDTLPAGTTFVSLASPGGWSCTTPAVGAAGTISCSNPSMAVGNAVFTLTAAVSSALANGTVLTDVATVTSATADPAPANNTATATTNVLAATVVSATKTVSGTFTRGGNVTYTIVLTNNSSSPQGDNPGNEFVDVLPATLVLISASATSGTAVANTGANTVNWNGAIAAGAAVTITIQAQIASNVSAGQTISNQGTVFFDADGNGTNESSAATDNPAVAGSGNVTSFAVAADAPTDIPALDASHLLLLALLMIATASILQRRHNRK